MSQQPSLTIPKDLIEPIIKTHMQAALAEALGDKSKLLEKMAVQVLNAKVDYKGNVPRYSSDEAGTFIDIVLKNELQDVVRAVLREELDKHKERVRAALVAELQKKNSPIVKAMVEGLLTGVITHGLSYSLTVKLANE